MAKGAVIKIKDNGYTNRLRAIKSLDGKVKAKAGIFGAKGDEQHDEKSGLTDSQLAAIHEFGLGVPERPFLRSWFDGNKKAIRQKLQEVAHEVVGGKMDVYQAMEEYGQWAEQELGAYLEAGIPYPLSDYTIAKKGSSTPLIDTTNLFHALTHAVSRDS